MHHRRAKLQFKVIFSNILQKPDSIFFFRRWQDTYRAFQRRILKQYEAGMRCVGYFDLAAFYDTISHKLLLKRLYPRTTSSEGLDWMHECLRKWSSNHPASGYDHGLPQGPLASDFLAECFMLPIDLALQHQSGYMRYVDDIRILGRTENEVRAGMIELERRCREQGLIPQTGKFAIRRCQNVQDAIGMLPSILDPQREAGTETIGKRRGLRLFLSAIGGKPYRVKDKTRLRYVLYRAEPDSRLLKLVLRLIPRHPEHADVFFMYLGRFKYRKPIERLCLGLVENYPYSYVRAEAWHVLARYRRHDRSTVFGNPNDLTTKAITISKRKTHESFVERWGTCHFLCVSEELSGYRHTRFLKFQEPLLQSFLAPVLPDTAFDRREVAGTYLGRTTPEPGLSVCSAIHERSLTPATYGIQTTNLPSQVANTLRTLGVLSAPGPKVDPIAEILKARYGVPQGKSWHRLLDTEYVHALGLLKRAEALVDSGRSAWLICQNSFNNAIFLKLQDHLSAIGHAAACPTCDKKGQLIDFGAMLGARARFSKNCPNIGEAFREMNARRNRVPMAHPYEKKTVAQARYLTSQERNRLLSKLRIAYADLVGLMPA